MSIQSAQDGLRESIRDFSASGPRNKWIYKSEYKIYVRRDRQRQQLDLASIEVYIPGQGMFREVILPAMEAAAQELGYTRLMVENVGDPRFAQFFRNRGYREIAYGGIPSFLKE